MPAADIIEPPVAPAAQVVPAPIAPAPNYADFDKSFPDDGLDSPAPAPSPAPSPASKPDEQSKPSKAITQTVTQTPTGELEKKGAEIEKGKASDAPAALPKEPEPHDEYTPPQVAKPSELRNWARRVGDQAKKYKSEVEQLQGRVRQLESAPSPNQSEETTAIMQELVATKKQLEQYEHDIRLTKYERSDEYRTKYQAPYQQAVKRAYAEVKELLAYSPNPNFDEAEGESASNQRFIERTATPADFDEIYQLPTGQAIKRAKQLFGDAAMSVIGHRSKIKELAESAYSAVEEYKAKGGEQETRTRAEQAQREVAMQQMFGAARMAYGKKAPEVFLPREGDEEGNLLLTKATAFADAVFGGNDGLTPVQIAARDARAHSWIAAYPRIVRDLKKAQTELAEMKATVESLRASGPGKPAPTTEKVPATSKSWEEEFDSRIPA